MPPQRKPIAERFWPKVERGAADACWPWRGAHSPTGYGLIASGGRVGHGGDGFMRQATHVAWELAHDAPWPDGLEALHSCDNPPCVNPAHLRPGTQADNLADMSRRGRGPTGDRNGMRQHPLNRRHGEQHWNAVLTETVVREIRRLRADGLGYKRIAQAVGSNPTTVKHVIVGATWRHVI